MTDARIDEANRAGGFANDPATLHSAMSELRAHGIAAFERLFGSEASAELPCHALNAWLRFDPRDIAAVDRLARETNESMPFEPYDPPTHFAGAIFAAGAAGGTMSAISLPERIKRWLLDLGADSFELAETVPDAGLFFDEVAATAFSAPQFRRSLLRHVRSALRGRVLFGIEGPPEEPPAVQTCLALVTAAGRPPDLEPAAWERFRFGAVGMIERPGWARFWDLWLLDSARRRGGFVLTRVCAELAASLEAADANPDDIPGHEALASGWREGVPGYAVSLLSGRP